MNNKAIMEGDLLREHPESLTQTRDRNRESDRDIATSSQTSQKILQIPTKSPRGYCIYQPEMSENLAMLNQNSQKLLQIPATRFSISHKNPTKTLKRSDQVSSETSASELIGKGKQITCFTDWLGAAGWEPLSPSWVITTVHHSHTSNNYMQ